MTDSTQELDGVAQLIATYLEGLHNPSDNYLYNELRAIRDTENLKQAILDWHNKQIEAVLDRLDKSMPTAEQLTTKYGYHMPEKQYGYKLALHDIREVIAKLEAEL